MKKKMEIEFNEKKNNNKLKLSVLDKINDIHHIYMILGIKEKPEEKKINQHLQNPQNMNQPCFNQQMIYQQPYSQPQYFPNQNYPPFYYCQQQLTPSSINNNISNSPQNCPGFNQNMPLINSDNNSNKKLPQISNSSSNEKISSQSKKQD